MKKILLLASAVVFMASCSQSEDFGTATELTNPEISFANAFVKNSQRLTGEMMNSTIAQDDNTFGVWGYKKSLGAGDSKTVFEGATVTFNDSKWDYENHRYWDAQASYTFVAAMPNDLEEGMNATVAGDGQPVVWDKIPLSALVGDGVDYLVAKQETVAKDAPKGTVKFTFQHLLSKLNVFAAATCNADDKVTLTKLTLHLPNGTAKYEEKTVAQPTPTMAFANDGDKWTWTLAAQPLKESPVETAAIQLNNSKIYKKLSNSYFVAPTVTGLTKEQIAAGSGAHIKMDVSFKVTYKGGATEDFAYTNVEVKDLHTFTQGYITNLYVNINLNEIEFGVDKVISFASATVTDWADSDDSYIDEQGYSFNFKNVKTLKSDETALTPVAVIENYGNTTIGTSGTGITYTAFEGAVYSDKECTTKVTGTSAIEGMNINVTGLKANTTQDVKTYYIKVVTNQGDERILAFTQAAASPILIEEATATEISSDAAMEITRGEVYTMRVAHLDEGKTARIIVRDLSTGEEVNVTTDPGIGNGTVTAGNTGFSTIVSELKKNDGITITLVADHKYAIEILYEGDPLLYKYYELQKDGSNFKAVPKP